MKKIIWLLIFFCGVFLAKAQVEVHTKESIAVSKPSAKVGEEVELIFQITIDKNWYIYSSELKVEGPLPTTFTFKPNPSYQLVGKIRPINPKKKMDEIWEGEISYFEKKAEFRQTIKVLKKDLKIEGSFEYSCCNLIDGKCLPPITYDFIFDKNVIKITASAETSKEENQDEKVENKTEEKNEKAENNDNQVDTNKLNSNNVKKLEKSETTLPKAEIIKSDETNPADVSLLTFMLFAFLAGTTALFTPCVYPMIPMTVTLFLKQSKSRSEGIFKAMFYGASIVSIYTFLGVIVAIVLGPTFANELSTHWFPNLLFFTLFVIFGLSFLGMFEIILPSWLVNKADKEADKGGLYGIFFLAFVLVLISFSCTAPTASTIALLAADGKYVRPILGMMAYSLAVAIPFTLFAIFPAWMNNLPKSGGWLNSVKVVLGFLELALALKFLSIADQVYHWRILDRDVYLALWIVIFGMIGFYLLGKIQLPHDSKMERISVPRAMLALFSLAFTIYLIPGLFGAPLKPLAGLLPPQTAETMDFFTLNNPNNNSKTSQDSNFPEVRFAELFHLPHGLQGFFDYKEGLAYAKKVNKPIFIDFTGHGCVNCREMEARVWSDTQVLKRLQNEYVVIALYVDDRTQLPENEWFNSTYDKKIKKTIGQQNTDFQIVNFNKNAQPYYCLLDHEGKLLIQPKAYDLNANNFVDFLDKGLAKFKNGVLAKN